MRTFGLDRNSSSGVDAAREPSHVLAAMGRDRETARSGLRLSVGPATTDADIDRVLAVLPDLVAQVRRGAAA